MAKSTKTSSDTKIVELIEQIKGSVSPEKLQVIALARAHKLPFGTLRSPLANDFGERGLPKWYIQKIASRGKAGGAGKAKRHYAGGFTQQQRAEILQEYQRAHKSGESIKSICAKYEVDPKTLRRWRKEAGID